MKTFFEKVKLPGLAIAGDDIQHLESGGKQHALLRQEPAGSLSDRLTHKPEFLSKKTPAAQTCRQLHTAGGGIKKGHM